MKNIDDMMEVGMGQIRKADSKTNQFTDHLKPCFGVGFYNTDTKESYMLHYPDLMFYDFEKDVENIKSDLGAKNTIVYACGGATSSTEDNSYNKFILEDRDYIETTLKDKFKDENISINWSSNDEMAELYLNKNTNEFVLKKIKN